MFRWLLEVEMSKKCTPLWREAQFEVKMNKTHHVQTAFGSWDVETVRPVVARSTCRSQKCKNWGVRSTFGRSDVVLRGRRKGLCTVSKVSKTWGFCGIFNYNHNYTTLHYTTLRYTTLHSTTLPYFTLHYIPLHYTTLRYTTHHYTTTTLHYIHYTPLLFATLHYATLNYTTLH